MSHRCVLDRFLATGDGELNMEQAICLSSLESRLYGLLFHMIFGQAVCTVSHNCTCIATHTRAWYMNADDLVDRVGHICFVCTQLQMGADRVLFSMFMLAYSGVHVHVHARPVTTLFFALL